MKFRLYSLINTKVESKNKVKTFAKRPCKTLRTSLDLSLNFP